jgi:hypothetical protein
MKENVSVVYLAEKIPFAQACMLSSIQKVIGEGYCNNHGLIVLDNTEEEIKILLAKEDVLCIDELMKVLPKGMRIHAVLVDEDEILRLFTRIYDLFGMNHCH